MDKFEIENREWRQERSRRLMAMLVAGEILPCEVREEMGKWRRLAYGKASEAQRKRRRRESSAKIVQLPTCAVEIDPPKICTRCGSEFISEDRRDKKCWRCQGYTENPKLRRQNILQKPPQNLTGIKKPKIVVEAERIVDEMDGNYANKYAKTNCLPCGQPRDNCVNCREIFGNEKCRYLKWRYPPAHIKFDEEQKIRV